MFEKFSDGARRVVVLAQEEARLLNHDYIGTEHLLLGTAAYGEGATAQVLRWFELTLPGLRRVAEEIAGRGEFAPSGHIPFTPRAKTALEQSMREAMRLDDELIRAEHILLALVKDSTSVAVRVLEQVAVEPAAVAARLEEQSRDLGAESTTVHRQAHAIGLRQAWGPVGVAPPAPVAWCSLCRRQVERVERVLVAGGVMICDRCVRDAAAQLDALTPDAPARVRFVGRDVAPPDQRAAVEAIQRAFDAVLGPLHVPPADALWAVESGDDVLELLIALDEAARHAPVVVNDQTIEHVRFVDEDEAEVGLGLWMANSTAPMMQPASAVREDGIWKVSRTSLEYFASLAQQFRRR